MSGKRSVDVDQLAYIKQGKGDGKKNERGWQKVARKTV